MIVSADVFLLAVAVNSLFCAVTTLLSGAHVAGSLYPFAVSTTAVGKSASANVSPDFTNVFPVPCNSFTPSPFLYVTSIASLGVGWLGSAGFVVFFAYTYSFCSTSRVDLSANLTSSFPAVGFNTSASVVLFALSVTVAPAKSAASLPSASCTLSANAAPFFQKSASRLSPTHAARSTPFSPPASFTSSAFEKAFRTICVPFSNEFVMLRLNFFPSSVITPLSRLFTL